MFLHHFPRPVLLSVEMGVAGSLGFLSLERERTLQLGPRAAEEAASWERASSHKSLCLGREWLVREKGNNCGQSGDHCIEQIGCRRPGNQETS